MCCYSIQVNTLTQDTLIKPALCSNHCPRPWGCMGGGHRPDPCIRSSQYNGETGSKWAKEVSGGSVGIEKTAVKEALCVGPELKVIAKDLWGGRGVSAETGREKMGVMLQSG